MKKSIYQIAMVCGLSLLMIVSADAAQKRRVMGDSDSEPSRATAGSGGGDKYGLSGCGLGSMLFKDRKNKVQQILAATTNGTSGNQTFAITTGTLNCESDGVVARHAEQEMFVSANFDNLSRDAAVGKGETISAFANLMGCEANAVSGFARFTQKHHEALFSGMSGEQSTEVVRRVRTLVSQDQALAGTCSRAQI